MREERSLKCCESAVEEDKAKKGIRENNCLVDVYEGMRKITFTSCQYLVVIVL